MGPPRACGCAHTPDDRYTPCETFAGSLAGVQWNVAGRTNGALVRTGGLAGAVAACAPTGESAVIAPASAKTVDRRAISRPLRRCPNVRHSDVAARWFGWAGAW